MNQNPMQELLTQSPEHFILNGETIIPSRDEFYTQYPFFKYWKNSTNQKLISVDPGINLYIHIPFCIQICDYCFYMREVIKSKNQVDEYMEKLCKEIEMVSSHFNLSNRKVNSIYIGGGTPSVLTESQFYMLVEALHKWHNIFDAEFTFEAEPGTFSGNKLVWYKKAGVNRISMGVQSFNDEIIKLSNRKHTSQQAVNSIKMCKEEGDFVVNIDLLSGLAGETPDSWEQSTDIAFEQDIDMLTIYKMKAYSNTMFFKKGVHENKIVLPSEEQEAAFMKSAFKKIKQNNFQLWSTFSFTRNHYKHHFTENTWRNHDLIAYGASAFGKIGNVNYQNLNNLSAYQEKIALNELPVFRTFPLSFKDMMVKEILLCTRLGSYSKNEFEGKFGFDYFNLIPSVISDLVSTDYIENNSANLVLTDKGILYSDFVSRVLASAVKDALNKDAVGFLY